MTAASEIRGKLNVGGIMKVLLALDSCNSPVIDHVISRPWPAETLFCVISVADLRHWEGLPQLIEDAKQGAESIAKCAADKLTQSGLKAFFEAPAGFPKQAITSWAEPWCADLILVGSHGHGAMTRLLLGSVAQAVLRGAHCAVEVVRRPAESLPSEHGTTILLATDGSDCSTKAIDFVAKHSWPKNSTVRILSVAELAPADLPSFNSPLSRSAPGLVDEICKQARTRADAAVAGARRILMKTGIDVCDATPLGDPRTTILEQSEACDVDLIVLGSHGRHGFERLLTGSVSEAVTAQANCSVAVVR
jgi:nucleotide-binding universal stress UspA family protein